MSAKTRPPGGRGAVGMIEAGVQLLRESPLHILALYYVGSLPFVLAFLYFWVDMSRSSRGSSRLGGWAVSLAILFTVMKVWHTVFTSKLLARLLGEKGEPWSLGRTWGVFASQACVQSTGLFILPLSLILTIPFGWTLAFYQNFTVLGDGKDGIRKSISLATEQSRLWPRQNHLLLGILSVFGLFVFLNVAISMAVAPGLLKSLFGLEPIVLSGSWHFLNTTFLAAALTISWLCFDPLLKAVYVQRCFYGLSLRSAMDLKAELRNFPGARTATLFLLLVFLLPLPGWTADPPAGFSGEESPSVRSREQEERRRRIDAAIDEEFQGREYLWRLPRDASPSEERSPGHPLRRALEWIAGRLKPLFKTLEDLAGSLLRWIGRLLPDPPPLERDRSLLDRVGGTRTLLAVFMAVLASSLALFLLRRRRRGRGKGVSSAGASVAPSIPDLSSGNVDAGILPSNRWLEAAKDLMGKGDRRLALRALYLGILSHLGSEGLLAVAAFKTNLDYTRELGHRARRHPDLVEAFGENVMIFDRVWYGTSEPDQEACGTFEKNLGKIMTHGG